MFRKVFLCNRKNYIERELLPKSTKGSSAQITGRPAALQDYRTEAL